MQTNPAPTLHWHDGLLLGYAPMDHVHQAFVDGVAHLQSCADHELSGALDALQAHLQDHFGSEDQWMKETDFPARDCHIEEHAAVLTSVQQVRERLAQQGDVAVCRRLADELARWFPGHADYLDSALAHWMCQQRLGGKPVVIRRQPIVSPPPGSGTLNRT